MGVGLQDFREGQVENRDETGKCSISRGFEGEFLLFVPEWHKKTLPILPFWPQMPSWTLEFSQTTRKLCL